MSNGLKKENSYVREQKSIYNEQCKQIEFYSLLLVYEEKEIDILVSNAGGHFNFLIVKDAIETLMKMNTK